MSYLTLPAELIIQIHDTILEDEPGLPGICRDKSLDGALDRVLNHNHYEGVDDIHELAALYGIAIAQGHTFNDGNKRTSLMAMYSFLSLNGFYFYEDEQKTKIVMMQVAQKEITLAELSNWLRINSVNLDTLKKAQRRLKRK